MMKMTAKPTYAPERAYIDRIGNFLSDYSSLAIRSGSTCARLEKNVRRMAAAWGVEVEMAIMPRHVHISVTESGGESKTFIAGIGGSVISYDIITRLSRLSWEVADDGWDVERAAKALHGIARTPHAGKWWVLLAVSCANGAFCRLFGGDMTAVGVVFAATMCGYYLKQVMLSRKIDVRVVFITCAFVSSVLACADGLFSLGSTPGIAIATSVLYLVPGIPLLNSFSDMIDRHYICFFSRMTDAGVLTCCLSIGLCAGMWVMNVGMF
ncbi:threonine/serine exporter ThrE family protein [uncultured Muribaculum sp.]|nr:threonine/serine exporter family protein [uncultured Muribaculum sp.]